MDHNAVLHNQSSTPIPTQQIGVSWSPPPEDCYNGSHSPLRRSACGGVGS